MEPVVEKAQHALGLVLGGADGSVLDWPVEGVGGDGGIRGRGNNLWCEDKCVDK